MFQVWWDEVGLVPYRNNFFRWEQIRKIITLTLNLTLTPVSERHSYYKRVISKKNRSSTEENDHGLDQISIRGWKHVGTGINTYLKNQV